MLSSTDEKRRKVDIGIKIDCLLGSGGCRPVQARDGTGSELSRMLQGEHLSCPQEERKRGSIICHKGGPWLLHRRAGSKKCSAKIGDEGV